MVNPRRHHYRHRRQSSSASESSSSSSSSSSSVASSVSSGATAHETNSAPVSGVVAQEADLHDQPVMKDEQQQQRVWRFLDTEETCHFFNTEIVVRTNDVLQLELEADDAIELQQHFGGGSTEKKRVRAEQPMTPGCASTALAQLTYDDIFSDFDDLYLPCITRDTPRKLRKRREEQYKQAAHVLRSYCSDLLTGQNYLYRKRTEFLRVCFQRVVDLQAEPVVTKSAGSRVTSERGETSEAALDASVFHFPCSRREHPVDVTIPELGPRKWPHLPFRNPREWMDNAADAIVFAKRVCELPEGSLLYEPIDVALFTARVCDLLEAEGVNIWATAANEGSELSRTALAALAATIAVAIRLQSFSLLVLVGDLCMQYGASTVVSADRLGEDVIDIFARSSNVLQSFAVAAVPPATYPRALVAQWTMASYQPSTSDAIATDGNYLYVYGRSGLMKVGTGRGATLRDFVYDHNKSYVCSRDVERSWLCLIGGYLYCRSIIMPSCHIDRISVDNLNKVDELLFAPPHQVPEKPSGPSTVYAMVTDGVDLFTIHSIDSQKRGIRKKSRAKKASSKEVVKTLLARAAGSSSTASSVEANPTISVGDRVVRGPHWKWGSQDGEQGSPGTVQRISTWGGVKGCGITVRWDKNQRVNTYRWGAEGSYDIVIVVEKAGGVLEKQPLPVEPSGVKDETAGPRHLFVINRYHVSELLCVGDLEEEAMNSFMGLSSTLQSEKPKVPDQKYSLQTTIHEHTLCLSSATTAWLCDGGTSDCLCGNSGIRYRCEEGCDFDLCEVCLADSVRVRPSNVGIASPSDPVGVATSDDASQQLASSTGAVENHDVPALPEQTAEDKVCAQVDELVAFWCGLFSRKECEIAYRRCNQSLEESVTWLSNSGHDLKKRAILAYVDSVVLESPPNCRGLDPVLLVAGSFYAVGNQLCILSPPGLYQNETKRSIHASDATWFFSLKDGSLDYNEVSPVLLSNVPAGSPICADLAHRRILVFSGRLNCIEEYVIADKSSACDVVPETSKPLRSIGEQIFASLRQCHEKCWALPAYKRPSHGICDWISQIQQESCAAASAGVFARGSAINDPGTTKVRMRLIRKLRLRLQEFKRIGGSNDCGYFVPYCLDFRECGLRSLLCRLNRAISSMQAWPASCTSNVDSLVDVIAVLGGLLQDCLAADVKLHAPPQWVGVVDAVLDGLLDIVFGRLFTWEDLSPVATAKLPVWSRVVRLSQDVLLWGVEIGLFRHPSRWELLAKGGEDLLDESRGLPPTYMAIMLDATVSKTLQSASDCRVSLVKRLLTVNADAVDGGITDLVRDGSQAQSLVSTLFQLSARELSSQESSSRREDSIPQSHEFSPVEKALLTLLNGCAIDVMAEAKMVNTAVARQQRVGRAVGTESLLHLFASECFRTCETLLESAAERGDGRTFSESVFGKLLPLLFAMVGNGGSALWLGLQDEILQLATTIQKLHPDRSAASSVFLPESRVVESAHPYNRSQASLRKVVRIPGATCLHIQFDARCSTSSEADFVFVTPGHEWFHSERVPFGENGIGDAGGCFFGTRDGGNWPHPSGGISIWGDTATIMLCSTSQDREGTGAQDDSRRWGMKCVVRGVCLVEAKSWWTDTLLAMRYAVTTLSQCRLVMSQEALDAPLLRQTERVIRTLQALRVSKGDEMTTFLRGIIAATSSDNGSDGAEFVERVESAMQRRSGGRGIRNLLWKRAIRTTVAAVVANGIKIQRCAIQRDEAFFQSVVRDVTKIEQWMVRRVQLLKEWVFLQEDKVSPAQMAERLSADTSRLKELCALKGVHYHASDLKRSIVALHQILTSERSSISPPSLNHHDAVAEAVLDKATYAVDLALAVSSDRVSATGLEDLFHDGEAAATLFEYMTSETSLADIRRAEQHVARALGRRGDTLHMLQQAERNFTQNLLSVAGTIGSTWTNVAKERFKFTFEDSNTSTSLTQAWCTAICDIVKSTESADDIRLASMVDFLSAYNQFPVDPDSRVIQAFVGSVADLILHIAAEETNRASRSKLQSRGLFGYSMKELVWMVFRCGIETMFSEGRSEDALSVLYKMSGRLGSLWCGAENAVARKSTSDLVARVMKIACSHTEAIVASTSTQMWIKLCASELQEYPPGQPRGHQLASLRVMLALVQRSTSALSESLVRCLLERTGYLQSSMKQAADESEDKTKDCCVVIFENGAAKSKIVDAFGTLEESGLELACLPPSLVGAQQTAEESFPISARVAQEIEDSTEMVHRNVRCDGCNQSPMRGYRFKCFTCANFDLCSKCYLNQSMHDLDHQFVRHSSSSSVGERLQPRSNVNGAIVPETALVGSTPWMASVARALSDATGYVVLSRGPGELCIAHAKKLSEMGFAVTVMEWPDVQDLDAFYDWESLIQATFVPGAARLSRRAASAVSSSSPRKADRSVLRRFNQQMPSKNHRHEFLDASVEISELVALVRALLSCTANEASTTALVSRTVESISVLGPSVPLSTSEERATYYRTLGLVTVLGGFAEPLRLGARVLFRASASSDRLDGVVKKYGIGGETVKIVTRQAPGPSARDDLNEMDVPLQHVEAMAEVELENLPSMIGTATSFFSTFAAVLKTSHKLRRYPPADLARDSGRVAAAELGVAWLRMYMSSMAYLPSLLDNPVSAGNGNMALLLFQLAKTSKSGDQMDVLEKRRRVAWAMQQALVRDCRFKLACRPIGSSRLEQDPSCIYGPGANGLSDSTEYVFNMYAYSSRAELPKHSGRNKLLEYWEKNVIPAIESYVAGSFKSYEMDYFFAQLREPLREGNPAAAMKIAFTLCDGHVPSGCQYPDPDMDWTALQIDDVEVGAQYLITSGSAAFGDVNDWPAEMQWTVGHTGVVRNVYPSGLVLIQLRNPQTERLEHWWYEVDCLISISDQSSSISDRSVDKYESALADLVTLDMEMMGVMARKCVFAMLQEAPEQFPLVSDRQSTKIHFHISDILRMAAVAELGFEADTILGQSDVVGRMGTLEYGKTLSSAHKYELLESLHQILTKRFEYVPSLPSASAIAPMEEQAMALPTSKGSSFKYATPDGDALVSSIVKNAQPSASAPALDSLAAAVKYRYNLMEALVQELQRALDASTAFLKRNSFMVASESPPKPMIMLSVPGASCLVISFAVHPVLMDLPAGSSLEFFRDEACTNRICGYFGDSRGLNFLPPLVVPGEKCFVRASQASYARFKFRVDPLTRDFGLALWIAEQVYQRLTASSLTGFELESIVSSALNAITEYLVGSGAALAPCTKGVTAQLLTKMINFVISRSLANSVPLSKLSVLTRDLAVAYDHELSAQKGLFSLPTQQLTELLSAVEEVSRLRGVTSSIVVALPTQWWSGFVKLATFTRVLTHKRDPAVSTDAVTRVACGRMPIEAVDEAWRELHTRDLLSERMVLLQCIPQTTRVAELAVALSRFIQHIALDECGEADDQTVLSATEVLRCGILANVVHLPVNADGATIGYAVVDIGRHDIVPKVLARLPREKLDFEGDSTEEDAELAGKLSAVFQDTPSKTVTSNEEQPVPSPTSEENMWACGVCTLENPLVEVECAACGSPIPSELVELALRRQSQQHHATGDTESNRDQSSRSGDSVGGPSSAGSGWQCEACTLVNPWELFDCIACGSERDPSVVEPSSGNHDSATTVEVASDDATVVHHILRGVSLVDVMRVASTERVSQIESFLISVFTDSKTKTMSRGLEGLLASEKKASLSPSSDTLIHKIAVHYGLEERGDSADELMKTVYASVLEAATSEPLTVFKWVRESGYDLHFERNHYPELGAARGSQAKWTYVMDIQLVALARQISARLGVLSVMDLCPSHITSQASEGSPLGALESRDLRLRFALLKMFNKTAQDALPLVNLRNVSDPMALRSRLVAVRQLLFPAVKIRFVADTQDNANLAQSNLLDTAVKRPVVTLDRRRVVLQRAATAKDTPTLRDSATSLFASTMAQLAHVKPSILRAKRPTGASDPFVAFMVVFAGENVVGEGGPYRQLFNDIAAELLSPGNPLFVPTQNNLMKIGDFRDRYLPQPSSKSKTMLEMYEFVGVLMGCCIRTGVRLNIRLAPIAWKMLVKQSLTIADLEHIDWSVCESLKFIEAAASGDSASSTSSSAGLGDIYYDSFTTALSDGTTVELKPGGLSIPVSKSNCKEYVRLVKAARFHECKPQVDAILRGIGTIVPVPLLQLCTWSELQQWVCGSLAIDVDLLKRHTVYSSGMTPDRFPHLDMFWRVLSNFSEANKRSFINFAWGQDTLPADDAEFDRTHTRLLLKAPPVATTTDQDGLLPKADTCTPPLYDRALGIASVSRMLQKELTEFTGHLFSTVGFFNIELPAYSAETIMREKLLLAITMCTSMDGDEQTGRMDLYFSTDDLDDEHME